VQLATVRFIDRFLGISCCFVLTVLRRLASLLGLHRPSSGALGPILFIKLSEQGALVLAYAAIQRAIRLVGRDNVYFCVFRNNREILDLMDLVPADNILTLRDERLGAFVADLLRAVRRMRRLRLGAAVDLELFARVSALLGYLSGARRRVGLHRFHTEGLYRGDLLTHRAQYSPYLHTSAAYDLMVAALERDTAEIPMVKAAPGEALDPPPKYVPAPEEAARIEQLLGTDPAQRHVVVFNPKCMDEMPVRRWPADRYVDLGKRLLDEWDDVCIAVTGLSHERDACDALCRAIDPSRTVCLAGDLNLRELVALCAAADVLVSTDSGPAHFAALTDVHIVALFGPETPALYGPVGPRVHVLSAGLACTPCLTAANHRNSPCTDNQCMQAITVDEVYAKLRECLPQRRA